MRRLSVLLVTLGLALAPGQGEEHQTASGEEVILDAPGGRPVAILLPGATRILGDSQGGFIRVTLEGWLRLPSASGMPPTPAPLAASPSASLSGRIRLDLPSGEARYGAGARVILLGTVEKLEDERAELMARYDEDRARLEDKIAGLEMEAKRALNSSDNFREATLQRDRAKIAVAAAQKELLGLSLVYTAQLEELFARHQVAETVADGEGRYSLSNLEPGPYRLLAIFTEGEAAHRWYLPVEMGPQGGQTLDLGVDETLTDPYRSLQAVD